MDVEIREQELPGHGTRYELDLGDGHSVVVVAERSGARTVGFVAGDHAAPQHNLRLHPEQAVAVAAILLGARFSVISGGGGSRATADVVDVATVTLLPASPLIGRTAAEYEGELDADAAILAVICDETPAIVEDERSHRCWRREGDSNPRDP
jgi:K+/H+ antiporter YhaU regulatory subunit KhtT